MLDKVNMDDGLSVFGDVLKTIRLRVGFGLRKFADLLEMPASNLSAIEHGRRAMPEDKIQLAADVLGIEKGSIEWNRFFDLAAQSKSIPVDIQNQILGNRFIPALLRTIDNRQFGEDDVKKLIDAIRNKDGSTQTGPS